MSIILTRECEKATFIVIVSHRITVIVFRDDHQAPSIKPKTTCQCLESSTPSLALETQKAIRQLLDKPLSQEGLSRFVDTPSRDCEVSAAAIVHRGGVRHVPLGFWLVLAAQGTNPLIRLNAQQASHPDVRVPRICLQEK